MVDKIYSKANSQVTVTHEEFRLITNNHWIDLCDKSQLSEYDRWINDADRIPDSLKVFFFYRGVYHCITDFKRTTKEFFPSWDGYVYLLHGNLVIKLSPDKTKVKVGHYIF